MRHNERDAMRRNTLTALKKVLRDINDVLQALRDLGWDPKGTTVPVPYDPYSDLAAQLGKGWMVHWTTCTPTHFGFIVEADVTRGEAFAAVKVYLYEGDPEAGVPYTLRIKPYKFRAWGTSSTNHRELIKWFEEWVEEIEELLEDQGEED